MFNSIEKDDDVDIFTLSDRGVDRATNTPAVFVRSMIHARGFTASTLDSCANLYVRHITDNDKHRSSTKSNLLRAIRKPAMSWNTFLRFVAMARIKKTEVFLKVSWEDGVETFHKHEINGDLNYLNETDLAAEIEAAKTPAEAFKEETQAILDRIEQLNARFGTYGKLVFEDIRSIDGIKHDPL